MHLYKAKIHSDDLDVCMCVYVCVNEAQFSV